MTGKGGEGKAEEEEQRRGGQRRGEKRRQSKAKPRRAEHNRERQSTEESMKRIGCKGREKEKRRKPRRREENTIRYKKRGGRLRGLAPDPSQGQGGLGGPDGKRGAWTRRPPSNRRSPDAPPPPTRTHVVGSPRRGSGGSRGRGPPPGAVRHAGDGGSGQPSRPASGRGHMQGGDVGGAA